jgi:hypothetical protein
MSAVHETSRSELSCCQAVEFPERLGELPLRFTAYADSVWVSARRSFPRATRRWAAALVVVGTHIAAFMLMRDELLRQRSVGETPEFVSILVPDETRETRAHASAAQPRRQIAARPRGPVANGNANVSKVPRAAPEETAPRAIRPPRIDWLGEAESAARDQIASEADRKRRSDWLSRGIDPETHPLVLAMKPMFGKTPEFGWSHEHTHRIEHVPGGPLLFWINRRCVIAFLGLAIFPACALGHIEPNGALFEHMSDASLPEGPNTVP